jgi:hypothetical protein
MSWLKMESNGGLPDDESSGSITEIFLVTWNHNNKNYLLIESSVFIQVVMAGKSEGKRQPRRQRTRCYNIKMDLKQITWMWFRIGATSCNGGSDLRGSIKCRDLTEQLLAFWEGLYSMELVSQLPSQFWLKNFMGQGARKILTQLEEQR